jgi:hypothetical protein
VCFQEDSKAIQVKLFGKIKIFLADQKQFPVPSEEELKRIDEGFCNAHVTFGLTSQWWDLSI